LATALSVFLKLRLAFRLEGNRVHDFSIVDILSGCR
jgi:hypothetical protein